MLTKTVKRFYHTNRIKGRRPSNALSHAKDQAHVFHAWDIEEEAGKVRCRIEPDEYIDYNDLAGDCFDVGIHKDTVPGGERTILAEEKAFKTTIEQDGVWGYVVERWVYCSVCKIGEWEIVDSCGGFVGSPDEDYFLSEVDAAKALALRNK